MKKNIFLFLLIVLLFAAGRGIAQNVVEVQVFAEIIPALTATEVAQMNFGRFSPRTEGGQVMITPDGTRMATGSVVLAEGPHQSARFFVTGEINSTYSITLPEENTTITNVNSSRTMTVSNWISSPIQGTGTGLLAGGGQEVRVGATLTVGSMEENPVGLYSGTFVIRFDYN